MSHCRKSHHAKNFLIWREEEATEVQRARRGALNG